eukprot:TRINITY_DN4483_c1_g1_i1.p1 TRINITY_DN4483_c1_g1~~TRINITY_DN4483_c1_g1_i1.p1  ORF type:complete len:380 (-),score=159.68 TRINITY_DN4483_c1_g1_i1:52-1125(-)
MAHNGDSDEDERGKRAVDSGDEREEKGKNRKSWEKDFEEDDDFLPMPIVYGDFQDDSDAEGFGQVDLDGSVGDVEDEGRGDVFDDSDDPDDFALSRLPPRRLFVLHGDADGSSAYLTPVGIDLGRFGFVDGERRKREMQGKVIGDILDSEDFSPESRQNILSRMMESPAEGEERRKERVKELEEEIEMISNKLNDALEADNADAVDQIMDLLEKKQLILQREKALACLPSGEQPRMFPLFGGVPLHNDDELDLPVRFHRDFDGHDDPDSELVDPKEKDREDDEDEDRVEKKEGVLTNEERIEAFNKKIEEVAERLSKSLENNDLSLADDLSRQLEDLEIARDAHALHNLSFFDRLSI